MKSDIDIFYEYKMKDIKEIANNIGIPEDYLECYGKYKAKIDPKFLDNSKKCGKLILVTSINPTPYGEGKTTMAISLCDGICALGYKAIVDLREPSMGPVFGIKGGATGGGYSQVVPMDEINLHFTGDMHAITAANNLLCAQIDNHIFGGNELRIKKVLIPRCLDVNDRALRHINLDNREDRFVITVATELMAILCLAKDLLDLKYRINKMIVAINKDNKPIYVSDLKCGDALTIIMKDAIKPNLVQTLEGNVAIIHGGPFANIAHGCSSLISTNTSLRLADYVVTEAGFGSDLGAEKFFDIKCRYGNLIPNCIVINATIRSIKHNGECPKEELSDFNMDYLEKGISNLEVHIDNMLKFTTNIVVCLNKFYTDLDEEIEFVRKYCENRQIKFVICESHSKGSKGAIDYAKEVIDICNHKSDFKMLYDEKLGIKDKMSIVANNIYHTCNIKYLEEAEKSIKFIEKLGLDKYPICVAKTQYSISDNPKLLGYPKDYEMVVKDVSLINGAGFIVVYLGTILTMPGLAKNAALLDMTIDENEKISGLF